MFDLSQLRFAQSPLFVLAVAISLGILLGHRINFSSRSLLVFSTSFTTGLALLVIWLVRKGKLKPARVLLVTTFIFTGFALSVIEGRGVAADRISRMYEDGIIAAGDPVELTGTIEGQPETAPQSFYLTLRAEGIRLKGIERTSSGTILLLAHVREPRMDNEYNALRLRHGARVRLIAILDREENFRNPGVLPFTEYLERKGYDATGVIKSPLLIERLDDEHVFLPLAWLYEWRELLEREFAAKFSAETAGVLDAALLGNRYNVSRATADRFRAGGTFHVLVIAGLHISFIAGVIFFIARALTRRRLVQFVLAVTFLWGYTIAVGAHAPVVRAALMFTLVVFAPLVARRANSLNVIGCAGLALLVWRPHDLLDPSFQLTFLSVLAIVLLTVPLVRKMQQVGSWRPTGDTPYPPDCARWFRVLSEALFWSERECRAEMARSSVQYRLFKTPIAARLEQWRLQKPARFAVVAIILSASVQVGMLPLLVIYFHRVSIASPVLNVFVGGLMAILGFVALLALMVSHVSAWLAIPLITLAEKVNWLMIHMVDPFSHLGLASIRLPHYAGWFASLYALYFAPLGFLIVALACWNPLRPALITKAESRIFSSGHLRLALAAFAVASSLILFHPFSAARPDGKLHVDFLDVGQGDSALLTMPDGTTLMIDGGGRPNIWNASDADEGDEPFERDTRSIGEGVVSEYLWSRGLDSVDYILATHADSDHIDGLNDVARNFSVRAALVARAPLDDPEYSHFAATMKEAGVPIEKIGAGDRLRFGNALIEILWPPPSANANLPSRNNDSVILRVRFGEKAMIFTGDIEKEGEAAVINEHVDLRSEIVKVAHHGSKTSSTANFVSETHPSLAIISVGRTSIFGHPHKEVVARWKAGGAEVMTTGQRGTISITTDGKELKIGTFVAQ